MTEQQPIPQAQDHNRCLGRLEGIAEQSDRRLDSIEKRLESVDRLEQSLTDLRRELTRRMDRQFLWLLGVQFGIVGLLFSILLKMN